MLQSRCSLERFDPRSCFGSSPLGCGSQFIRVDDLSVDQLFGLRLAELLLLEIPHHLYLCRSIVQVKLPNEHFNAY